MQLLAAELCRVTRGWLLLFAAERQVEAWARAIERAGGRFVRHGIATKRNPAPRFLGDCPGVGVEHIVIARAGQGRMRWNGRGRAAVWDAGPHPMFDWPAGARSGRKMHHPAQKPIHLLRQLLEDFTEPGELICDPFLGSGTTAMACAELGRRLIGWEIDPEFHAVAERRLAEILDGKPQLELELGGRP